MTARSTLFACSEAMITLSRPAAAGLLEDVPDAMVCDFGNGRPAAEDILHCENRPDCDGKTVDQLREQGMVFGFCG
jgi:hypothetical protein